MEIFFINDKVKLKDVGITITNEVLDCGACNMAAACGDIIEPVCANHCFYLPEQHTFTIVDIDIKLDFVYLRTPLKSIVKVPSYNLILVKTKWYNFFLSFPILLLFTIYDHFKIK